MRGDAGLPLRLRFAKMGKVRWSSHRDVARAFERAFRVEALPLAFSQGFAPHPKVSFGLALSVGYESDAEYLDVQLVRPVEPSRVAPGVSNALPEGIDVTGVVPIRDRAPSLQESVTAVVWETTVASEDPDTDLTPARATDIVAGALACTALETTRRRKGREVTEDVRPAIRRCTVLGPAAGTPGAVRLELECSAHPRCPKPDEVVTAVRDTLAVAGGLAALSVRRTHQWIERDGARHEPLAADARPRVPEARAS